MKRSLLCLVLAALPAAAVNIVDNGDFEFQNIGNTFFVAVNGGGNTLSNWNVLGNGIDVISNRTGQNQFVNTGQQSVDLAGSPGPGIIYQDLATVVSQQYVISFYVSSNGGPFNNALNVSWGGTDLGPVSTPALGTWQLVQFVVTATSTTTRLQFTDNIGGYQGALLDTVSVDDGVRSGAELPEPATVFAGLVGIALIALRRRS